MRIKMTVEELETLVIQLQKLGHTDLLDRLIDDLEIKDLNKFMESNNEKLITVQFRDRFSKQYLHRKEVTRKFLTECFEKRIVVGFVKGVDVVDPNGYYVIDI